MSELEFKIGDMVIYPSHGLGKIIEEEEQKIGDITIFMFVIEFVKQKMRLSIPKNKAASIGLRHLSNKEEILEIYNTLRTKPEISKGMWNRRVQGYEIKVNSGSLVSLAEVVRDLHKMHDDPTQSYSERQIYESALTRLINEIAEVEFAPHKEVEARLLEILNTKEAA